MNLSTEFVESTKRIPDTSVFIRISLGSGIVKVAAPALSAGVARENLSSAMAATGHIIWRS